MPDDLKQQLEQAQADYQKLYSQYQEELARIARWQKRVKTENETLNGKINAITQALSDLLFHAQTAGAGPDTLNALSAARATVFHVLNDSE